MEYIQPFLFWTVAALTALCALAVVVSQNIVRSATWLLFTLGGTSCVFFLLGADFVGAIQLLVYVGGTLVLVIFGVMLTAQGPFVTMKTTAPEWAISVSVGLLLLTVLCVSALTSGTQFRLPEKTAAYAPKQSLYDNSTDSRYSDVLGLGFLGIGVGPAHEEQGQTVRTHYYLPFIIVSVHLLVVLIGAAYLARAKRRRRVVS